MSHLSIPIHLLNNLTIDRSSSQHHVNVLQKTEREKNIVSFHCFAIENGATKYKCHKQYTNRDIVNQFLGFVLNNAGRRSVNFLPNPNNSPHM